MNADHDCMSLPDLNVCSCARRNAADGGSPSTRPRCNSTMSPTDESSLMSQIVLMVDGAPAARKLYARPASAPVRVTRGPRVEHAESTTNFRLDSDIVAISHAGNSNPSPETGEATTRYESSGCSRSNTAWPAK